MDNFFYQKNTLFIILNYTMRLWTYNNSFGVFVLLELYHNSQIRDLSGFPSINGMKIHDHFQNFNIILILKYSS